MRAAERTDNARHAESVQRLIANISQAFTGKDQVVAQAVLTLIAGGHLLLEDLPGLGKTLLAKALAQSVSGRFKRIQFTADLLPSDITGVNIYLAEKREFSFHPGPLFTNVLLGDEINRATPRTQSSLLEAMEEQHVTVDGSVYPLKAPFFVIATQNPVELEGTYPLPFAQMDRFLIRLSIGYLNREQEMQMLRTQQKSHPLDQVKPVMTCEDLHELQKAVREVSVETTLLGYLVDIVQATRKLDVIEYGASPRASLDLQSYSQATALLQGRDFVLPDDIKQSARLVLPHRLINRKGTRSVTVNSRAIVDQVLEMVPVPV